MALVKWIGIDVHNENEWGRAMILIHLLSLALVVYIVFMKAEKS